MSAILLVLVALFILIYGVLALIALRRPLLARLAAREALRRPGQSALLIAGLMIAGASIMAGLVLVDSFNESLTASVLRQWGRVDLTVTANGHFFQPEVASKLAADPAIQREAAGIQASVDLVASVADLDRRLTKPAVRVIGFDPASQPAFGRYVLADGRHTYGVDLAPASVLLSGNLAEALDARVGDQLQLTVQRDGVPQSVYLAVAGIARAEGPGAYGLTPALFAALDTTQRLMGTDRINVVRISAKGDGDAELAAAHRLAASVRNSLVTLPTGNSLAVREVKAVDLAAQEKTANDNRTFYLGFSLIVVLAAAALAVNLALALADERRPRLAIVRALGLTRRGLVTVSVLEGAMYSLAAAVLSTVPGILASLSIISHFPPLSFGTLPDAPVQPAVSVKPATVAVAIIAAALITLTTLVAAAWRTSRMTIAAAIRDLPEPRPQRARAWPRGIALAGVGLAAIPAVGLGNQDLRLFGGAALIVVGLAVARRMLPDRMRATLMGAGLALWAFALGASTARNEFPFFGLLMAVFGLCLVVSANLRLLETPVALLGRPSGRLRATLRPSLAYLDRRPLRTGLATGAFAVVLAMIATLAVFVHEATGSLRDSLRWDVTVMAPGVQAIALPQSVQAQVSGQVSIRTRMYAGPIENPTGGNPNPTENSFVRLFQLGPDQLANPPLSLSRRDARFASDAEVWQAVRDDPSWVVSGLWSPGQVIVLAGDQGPVRWRVAAQPVPGILDGLIGSPQAMAAFQGRPAGTTVLLRAKPGNDPRAMARDVQRSLFPQAVEAVATREIADRFERGFRAFIGAVNLLVSLGLATGVLTIGILALRAVVERRHAIGVLRAVGYRRRDVVTGLIAEAMLTTTLGVLIGLGAGAFFGLLLSQLVIPGGRYGMDGAIIGTTLWLIFGTLLLVTIAPAVRASRLHPAQALRIME